VRFGFPTDTYDADGKAESEDTAPVLDPEQLQTLASRFVGKIQQTPPSFSAKKVHGQRAHELARKHKPVNLEPVAVEVYEFQLTGVEGSVARFRVECGAGTYIRSLAHDMGKLQGSGAHLAEIVRTAVGEFALDHAVPLAELAEDAKAGKMEARVIRLENLLLELPRATVLPIVEKRVQHGAKFNLSLAQIQPGQVTAAQGAPAVLDSNEWHPSRLRVFNQQGQLIAIAEPVVPRTYQPIVVLETTSPS
jgi:tRNA pseudouridine55 synthase